MTLFGEMRPLDPFDRKQSKFLFESIHGVIVVWCDSGVVWCVGGGLWGTQFPIKLNNHGCHSILGS